MIAFPAIFSPVVFNAETMINECAFAEAKAKPDRLALTSQDLDL